MRRERLDLIGKDVNPDSSPDRGRTARWHELPKIGGWDQFFFATSFSKLSSVSVIARDAFTSR